MNVDVVNTTHIILPPITTSSRVITLTEGEADILGRVLGRLIAERVLEKLPRPDERVEQSNAFPRTTLPEAYSVVRDLHVALAAHTGTAKAGV